MYYKEGDCKKLYPIWGGLMGAVIFIVIYGVKILNPFYVDWLLGEGDLSQHYLGWQIFCRSDWQFPIGLTDRLAYPIKTSVIFTDSIPILAVPLKLFNKFLPQYFQYFGFWGILSFTLQGFLAAKIYNIWSIDWRCTLIGSIFIITAPIMLYRMYMHTSLGAQWIILAAMYFFLRYDFDSKSIKPMIYWGLLGFLVTGVHLYFLPMCFLFAAGGVVKSIVGTKKVKIIYCAPVITYILGACLHLFILGGFSSNAAAGADGFKVCSFNLNSFYNPRGFSRILPDMDSVSGFQHEGFAYLGVGVICLIFICIAVVLILRITNQRSLLKVSTEDIILICIGMICLLIAISPVVTFGEKELVEIPVTQMISKVWSLFRATGRFIWPAWYLLVMYSVKNMQMIGTKAGVAVLTCCLVLQIFDISEAIVSRHKRFTNEVVYEYTDDEFWQQLTQYRNFEHICISFTDYAIDKWLKIGAIALKYNLTTNAFYFARNIDGMRDNTEILKRESQVGDTIYVFLPEQVEMLEENKHNLRYYYLEDFVIGVSWLDDDGKVNGFSYE